MKNDFFLSIKLGDANFQPLKKFVMSIIF